ncbi:MAG: hypothetical protein ACUVQY_05460 [Thermoproteota archaeon]
MTPIDEISSLGLYFTLLLVDRLPEEWAKIAAELKSGRRIFIQFFNPSCLVKELVPFLVYNVNQAFKYGYNSLKGFEQELLIALYGYGNFQEALSAVGVSVSQRAMILLISEDVVELEKAASTLREEFYKRGSFTKPSEGDEQAFTSFWSNLLSKEASIKALELGYSEVLNLVSERLAIGYL